MHEPPRVDSEPIQPAADVSSAPAKANLGLLFVHGIGAQTEGVSLVQGGAPLLAWLRDWLHLKPQISHAVLKPSELSGENCAQAEFSVRVHGQPPQRILLAECLWARQFDPPPFRELCSWLLGYGAWIALRQFCAGVVAWFRRWIPPWIRARMPVESDGWHFVASVMLGFPGLLLVVVPLQLFLVTLYILSAVPVKAVKDWVVRLTVGLSEIIGDSYIFVANPVARSAITSKLLADLEWLEKVPCETVVVLAHSQGAAVAFDALRHRPGEKPVRLITYGAGIRKLFEIEQNIRSESLAPRLVRFAWLLFLLAGLACALIGLDLVHILSLPQAEMARAYDPDSHFASLFLLALYFTFFAIGAVANWTGPEAENAVDKKLKPAMARFLKDDVHWTDLHASNDPVPGGHLLQGSNCTWREEGIWQTCDGLPNFQTASVINERSTLADHTTYWNSADDFIVRVIERLDDWAKLGWLSRGRAIASAEIERMSRVRADRILLRQAGHFSLFVFVLALVVMLGDVWAPVATRTEQMPAVHAALSGLSVLPMSESALQSLRVGVLGIGAHLFGLWLYLRFVSALLWKWWDQLFQRHRLLARWDWIGEVRLLAWLLSILIPLYATACAIRMHTYWMLYHVIRNPLVKSFHRGDSGELLTFLGCFLLLFGAAWLLHRWMVGRLRKPAAASGTDGS